MFKNILVPTDLSQKSIVALDIAIKMALDDETMITLLHVIEMIEDDDGEFTDFYERMQKRALRKMDAIVKQYEGARPMIRTETALGKRVDEIVRFAYEKDIDLIILSSHKIEEANPMEGWATISYKVGILSHCPVMMVK